MTSNRNAALSYRNSVALHFHAAGLYSAGVLDSSESQAVPLPGKANLITGLPWTVMTRAAARQMELSEALDHASALAEGLGPEPFAVVLHRRGHCVGDSYVLTTLDQFVQVMQREQDERVEKLSA